MFDGPNSKGLSRKSLFRELQESLRRLDIDLYIIHHWDYNTPIGETMKALYDLVQSGRVRYIGASSMHAWQFQKAQNIAEKNGWTKFVSMQNLVNLIYREEEREMLPYCQDTGIAITPWSPLAKGKLSRSADSQTKRSQNDDVAKRFFGQVEDNDFRIVEWVNGIASKYNVSQTQIVLAWLISKEYITSPIIGTSKIAQLEDAVKSIDLILDQVDITYLEELYIPHQLVGFE